MTGDIATNGTASVVLTGTVAEINTTLADAAGVTYRGDLNFSGTDTLTVTTNDGGATGSGGAQTDSDMVSITVSAVNDAPVNTVPSGPLAATEDTDLVVTGISIADVDAGTGDVTVTLAVGDGIITVSGTVASGLVTGDIATNGTGSVVLTGTVAEINATLSDAAGVTYRGDLNFNGTDTLTVTTNDGGNTGSGSAQSDADMVAIAVSAVNDAPVNTVPAGPLAATEDTDLVVSGLSIADTDAGTGDVTVTLAVSDGIITVSGTVVGGLVAGDIATNGTASVVLTGTVAEINATLADAVGVTYRGDLNFNGSDTLTVTTNDGGNTGSGGAQTDADMVAITVSAVNDAPVNTVPAGPLAATEDTDLVVSGLSIADTDAGTGDVTVTLAVGDGIITVSGAVVGGLVAGDIATNGTGSVVLTGTVAEINATLADASGVTYRGDLNFSGTDTLTVTTNDGGNTGSGGAQTDSDMVAITVSAVNDVPVNTLPAGPLAASEDTNLAVSGLSVADVDAGTGDVTVTLAVGDGIITVSGTVVGGLVAGDIATNGTASVVLTGTVAEINATLADAAGVTYRGDLNFSGTDTLTVTTNDGGNTGSGSAQSDVDMVAITVSAVNDAPVNTVPAGPLAATEDTNLVVTGISIADTDAGTGDVTVTLAVGDGIITVSGTVAGGLVTGDIATNGTGSVVLTGTVAEINATLADASGVTYRGDLNFSGTDTLTVTTNDGGNTGSGAAQSDTDTVIITVTALIDVPDETVVVEPGVATNTDIVGNAENLNGDPITITEIIDPADPNNPIPVSPGSTVTLASGTTVTVNGDGTVTVTSNGSQDEVEPIGFTVTDANGGTDTVTLGLEPAPDETVVAEPGVATNTDIVGNAENLNGDPITITEIIDPADPNSPIPVSPGSTVTLASGTTVTVNGDGTVTVTSNGSQDEVEPIGFTVTDANGGTDTVTLGLEPAPEIDDPNTGVISETPVAADFQTPVEILQLGDNGVPNGVPVNVTEIEGVVVTPGVAQTIPVVQGGVAVRTLTITAAGGVTLVPTDGFSGVIEVVYTILDSDGGTRTEVQTVTIAEPPPRVIDPRFVSDPFAAAPAGNAQRDIGTDVFNSEDSLTILDVIEQSGTPQAADFNPDVPGVISGTIENVRRLFDNAENAFGRKFGAFDAGAFVGYSTRVSDLENRLSGSNAREGIAVDTLKRGNVIYVEISNSFNFGIGEGVVDYAVALADGRPLPDWAKQAQGGLLLLESPDQSGEIKLKITLVQEDGSTVTRNVQIQLSTGEVKQTAVASTETAPTFGQQLRAVGTPYTNGQN